jgi:hypothetical protein
MSYNFNNYSNEYELSGRLTDEMINLYGFNVNYIKTTKVNLDRIYGEITNLRADNTSVYNLSVYPENSAGFNDQNDILSKFGIMSFDSINLFASYTGYSSIYPDDNFKNGVGDLVVLPSKKVFEVTEIENQVAGVNNMFVYANQKNTYILKCRPYNFNHDEITITNNEEIPDFTALFNIANKTADKVEQDAQSTVQKNIDTVWGDLG